MIILSQNSFSYMNLKNQETVTQLQNTMPLRDHTNPQGRNWRTKGVVGPKQFHQNSRLKTVAHGLMLFPLVTLLGYWDSGTIWGALSSQASASILLRIFFLNFVLSLSIQSSNVSVRIKLSKTLSASQTITETQANRQEGPLCIFPKQLLLYSQFLPFLWKSGFHI